MNPSERFEATEDWNVRWSHEFRSDYGNATLRTVVTHDDRFVIFNAETRQIVYEIRPVVEVGAFLLFALEREARRLRSIPERRPRDWPTFCYGALAGVAFAVVVRLWLLAVFG